jgi:hypothetical protein
MDTFVVRVYRSGQGAAADHESLRGVVDEVSTGIKATFHDATELLAILHPQRLPAAGGVASETK